MYKIIKVKNNVFDVFGEKWFPWARVIQTKDGRLFHLKGDRLTPKDFSIVKKQLGVINHEYA